MFQDLQSRVGHLTSSSYVFAPLLSCIKSKRAGRKQRIRKKRWAGSGRKGNWVSTRKLEGKIL
jgi:hypothetical protein